MSGRRGFESLRSQVRSDPTRSRRVDAYKAAMATAVEIENLRELRRTRGFTQEQLADLWRTTQANISRLERTDDLFLSTLRGYIEAMGGQLQLTAVFEDGAFSLGLQPEKREPRSA